ncbi:MAG: class I SAM-dependent methyltransferase [Deltaproteobacteria bacterium]|nr:class I SAM-dependent methyltransferase [Deltaproteobacteria bacterium]
MNCRVCGAASAPFGRARIRGQHEVAYFRCTQCGFVQTEQPYWLEEAYREPINRSDTGILARNYALARITAALLWGLFDPRGRFVDYGGGYGVFVRLMRDMGFDFWWHDPHAPNLFAQGFEFRPGSGPVELVTAFECVEHMAEPVAEVEEILRISPSLLLSTEVVPEPAPPPGRWWYYGLDHGQHLGLFTVRALSVLARRLGGELCSAGPLHLLTRRKRSALRFRWLVHAAPVLWPLVRRGRTSRTAADSVQARDEP